MGLIKFGIDKSEKMEHPAGKPVAKTTVQGAASIDGDFTSGLGRGLGFAAGILGVNYLVCKVIGQK